MTTDCLIDTESLCSSLLQSIGEEDYLYAFTKIIANHFHADAVSILEYKEPKLHPVALFGISNETFGRRFEVADNPRLAVIVNSDVPTIFSDNIGLPDPFDGLINNKEERLEVHSCSGIPIKANGQLRGVITLDSLNLGVFKQFPADNFKSAAFIVAKIVQQALENYNLKEQISNKTLLNQTLIEESLRSSHELIGQSSAILHLKEEIEIVAPSTLSVLVTGETGVGKEVVVRTIHSSSKRFDKPLIYVNCAALPESIAESELFGHVKGAFTGATSNRSGKFELANSGTLFLDEIGELSLSIQAKLLRAIQNGDIQRVGSDRHIQVDVRLVAATNRDLNAEIKAGKFREDLYHRLSVYPIKIPPLRERMTDIELLVGFFIENSRVKLGIQSVRLNKNLLPALLDYPWPGNVRELEHIISRAMLRAAKGGGRIVSLTAKDLDSIAPHNLSSEAKNLVLETGENSRKVSFNENLNFNNMIDDYKRLVIEQAFSQCEQNWNKTAELLKVDKGNIHRLSKRLGLK